MMYWFANHPEQEEAQLEAWRAMVENRQTYMEWEIPEGLKPVTTSGGIMEEFQKRASERFTKGVNEYRGGDESLPFDGDPLEEACEETLDLFVYAKEAVDQELLSDTEADLLNCYAFDAFKLIRKIQDNAKIRAAQAKGMEED